MDLFHSTGGPGALRYRSIDSIPVQKPPTLYHLRTSFPGSMTTPTPNKNRRRERVTPLVSGTRSFPPDDGQ